MAFVLLCLYNTGSLSNSQNSNSNHSNDNFYTELEKSWLKQHPVIYYSELHRPPLFIVDSQVSGIGIDYLKLVAKDAGIKFKYISSNDLEDLNLKLVQGNICLRVAVPRIKPTNDSTFLTKDYISSPLSIVTSERYSYVQNIEQLDGLTVSINEDSYLAQYFRTKHPNINLVYTDSIDHALTLVSRNRADAFVGSMSVVAHYLRNAELYNLRVSGLISTELGLHFEVSPEHIVLKSIINKTLDRLSEIEKRRIANTWFAVNYHSGIRTETLVGIIAIGVLFVFFSLYWIRRLKMEIYHKELVEKALKSAREDAELANKAKSEFLANMSHEIRTPLNAIVGFSHLLSESELSEKQQSYLHSIRVGSDGLLHIINDILDLSKIEAGKMTMDYQPTDFHKLIEELTLLFEEGMKSKGIEFTVHLDSSVPQYLVLDANRVRQVLLNIIGNAQKFTNSGSVQIRVRASNAENNSETVDLIVDISDTGIGINEESLDLIFEHFEQNLAESKQQLSGTGLGLAISKKLAEKMGGDLSVVSSEGEGSCFTFRLFDIKTTEAFDFSDSANLAYKFDDSVVLLVDDIESNRILLIKYLEDYPFEIFVAENGLQAVELAKKIKPNIIFMDLRMPLLDGYEATKLIKKQQNTIIVALTASALEDEESRKKRKVFDGFLRKPVLKSKLIETMAQFISNETHVVDTNGGGGDSTRLELKDDFRKTINENFIKAIDVAYRQGDVSKLSSFVEQLSIEAEAHSEPSFIIFTNRLKSACDAFDVEEIDRLVRVLKAELSR